MTAGQHVARLPDPPYYAVIFTSERTGELDGYDETANRMMELARARPGFLGVESIQANGRGVTISYWSSKAAISGWQADLEHRAAQRDGRERWYSRYAVRVAKVERAYAFDTLTAYPGAEREASPAIE